MRVRLDELTQGTQEVISGGVSGKAGGDDWLKQINEVVKNVTELVNQYNAMRGGQSGIPPLTMGAGTQPPAVAPQPAIPPAVTNFIRQFLDNLIQQGHSDKPIGEVITELPITVAQIKTMIEGGK